MLGLAEPLLTNRPGWISVYQWHHMKSPLMSYRGGSGKSKWENSPFLPGMPVQVGNLGNVGNLRQKKREPPSLPAHLCRKNSKQWAVWNNPVSLNILVGWWVPLMDLWYSPIYKPRFWTLQNQSTWEAEAYLSLVRYSQNKDSEIPATIRIRGFEQSEP